jgi:hypothetical protein
MIHQQLSEAKIIHTFENTKILNAFSQKKTGQNPRPRIMQHDVSLPDKHINQWIIKIIL